MEPGARFRTGANGRVILIRNGSSIAISRNSDMRIAPKARAGVVPQILHTLGTLLFRIENGPPRNLRVRTPYP